MVRSGFPPGYRFCPTDVELVMYYLKRKVMGKKLEFNIISEVDIYKYEPSDLPDQSCLLQGDLKWYFFCPRGRKYGTGDRTNRATDRGYWKTTGRDRPVQYKDKVVGMIKTLVYHTGKAPHGERTDWVMHEYRLLDKSVADPGLLDTFVLCVIFHKDGRGPRNGAQYGAPFIEEEWTDNEDNCVVSPAPSANFGTPTFINPGHSVASTSYAQESLCGASSSEVHSFEAAPPVYKALPTVPENYAVFTDDLNGQSLGFLEDDVFSILDLTEDGNMISNEVTSEKVEEPNCEANTEAKTRPDENDFYSDLGDIGPNGAYNLQNGYMAGYAFDEMLPSDDVSFLELSDLERPLFPVEGFLTGPRRADDIYAYPGYFCDTVDTPSDNLHIADLNNSSHLPPE